MNTSSNVRANVKSPPVSGVLLIAMACIAFAIVLTVSTSILANFVFDLVGLR